MSEVFCREVPTVQDYIDNMYEKLGIERTFNKTKIILKESEFKTVNRIINKYIPYSDVEFDTIFKLYKLQRFVVPADYNKTFFKGTNYSYPTLNCLKSFIKSSTIDSSIEPKDPTKRVINSFIAEIKDISKPFAGNLVDGKRKRISELLKSGITQEEKDFINSEIKPRHIIRKGERMNNKDSSERFKVLVANSSKGVKVLSELIPDLKYKSLTTYLSFIHRLNKGMFDTCPPHCPTALYEAWLEYKTNPNEPEIIEVTPIKETRKVKSTMKLNRFTEDDYKIIVNNYKKSSLTEMKNMLPNRSGKTVENYVFFLRKLDKGEKKPSSLPNFMYNLWKQNSEMTTRNLSEQTMSEVMMQREMKKQQTTSYIITQGDKIIFTGDSKQSAEDYKKQLIESIKIYQLID